MRTVTLGSWTFTADAIPRPGGRVQVFSTLRGWDDGAGVRSERVARPTSHGEFAERGWREGRLVTLGGFIVTSGEVEAAEVAFDLAALLADGGFTDLTVEDALRSLSTSVQLGGAPLVERSPSGRGVRFQFDLLAPDPLRYGPPVSATTGFPELVGGLRYPLYTDGSATTGWLDYGPASTVGEVTLANEGTATAHPQFEVAGPVVGGFEVVQVGTGKRLVYDGDVPAGSVLVIDTATGVALMDGASDRTLTWHDPVSVPARSEVTFVFLPRGPFTSAVLTAGVAPAWW